MSEQEPLNERLELFIQLAKEHLPEEEAIRDVLVALQRISANEEPNTVFAYQHPSKRGRGRPLGENTEADRVAWALAVLQERAHIKTLKAFGDAGFGEEPVEGEASPTEQAIIEVAKSVHRAPSTIKSVFAKREYRVRAQNIYALEALAQQEEFRDRFGPNPSKKAREYWYAKGFSDEVIDALVKKDPLDDLVTDEMFEEQAAYLNSLVRDE